MNIIVEALIEFSLKIDLCRVRHLSVALHQTGRRQVLVNNCVLLSQELRLPSAGRLHVSVVECLRHETCVGEVDSCFGHGFRSVSRWSLQVLGGNGLTVVMEGGRRGDYFGTWLLARSY